MLKQKIAGICLSALVLAGICTGAPLFAQAEGETEGDIPEATSLTTENAELFLPESYEQYLPLDAPTYMSMNDDYIAVSDGQTLYFYDKTVGSYSTYQVPLQQENDRITKIQFSDDGRLFFSAGGLFYEYSFETGEATEYEAATCVTFLVVKDSLYTVRSSEGFVYLIHYFLSDISRRGETRLVNWESTITPKLSYQDGQLYIIRENADVSINDITTPGTMQHLKKVPLDKTYGDAQITGFQFACAYGDYLYYTVNGTAQSANGLYRTDFAGNAEHLFTGDGFTAINTYNGNLYCIRGASVLELSVTEDGVGYSGYEIAASSSSVNRLAGATDAVRAGDLLVTADSGNNRVSVYDFGKREYTVIDCGFTPLHVATDGSTIAVSSETDIYVSYPDASGHYTVDLEQVTVSTGVSGTTVSGLTCIFGEVYFVLNSDLFGIVGGESVRSAGLRESVTGITSDLYGSIYVSTASGSVYAYSEDEFLKDGATGTKSDFTLPASASSLRADFEGNVYCIAGSAVYRNGKLFARFESDFVYGRESAEPCSFALGFENNTVYFLFGDYYVASKTDVLDIPTLDRIAVADAAETCFSDHEPTGLLTTVPEHAIGIQTNLNLLKQTLSEETAYFPYETYFRTAESKQGIVLAVTDKYTLVLLENRQDRQNHGYKAALFRTQTLSPESEYYEEENKNAYLSSAVSSYYVPALCTDLGGERLSRGISVTVHGYVHTVYRDYARISYETEENGTAYGYVPASYLTEVNPLAGSAVNYTAGYVKQHEDGILFTAADGETINVTERTRARLYADGDGYLARVEKDGKAYFASVTADDVDWGSSDALRISLIIILTVLALVIIGAYVFLMPWRRSGAKQKKNREKDRS